MGIIHTRPAGPLSWGTIVLPRAGRLRGWGDKGTGTHLMIDLAKLIRDVPDFPVEGILFKDITTLLQDAAGFKASIDALVAHYAKDDLDQIVAIESRGFIFGAPMAYELGTGFVPVRKLGKLPSETVTVSYELEYGTSQLEMHIDAIEPGDKVLIVDDLLATGGSAQATCRLVEQVGGHVIGFCFLIELEALRGREALEGYPVFTLIRF
jgi:adenine phosphoribosyltransferase